MFSNGSRSKYNCPIWKERRHATAEHRSTAAGNWLLINWVTGARKRFQEPRERFYRLNLKTSPSRRAAGQLITTREAQSPTANRRPPMCHILKWKENSFITCYSCFGLHYVESRVSPPFIGDAHRSTRRQRLTLIRNGILTIFPFGVFGVISGKCQLFSNPIKDSP